MKKHFLLMLTLAASLTASAQENLATGGTAKASSVEGSNVAANAIDGDATTTRWESNHDDNESWQLDLGSAKDFNSIQIVWEGAYAQGFTIDVGNSVDAEGNLTGGTNVVSTTYQTLSDLTQTIPFTSVNARYIKFTGTDRTTTQWGKFGYSFYEFRVYNNTTIDTEAPVITKAETSNIGADNVTLSLEATDNLSTNITYIITDAANSKKYIAVAKSGATTCNITGLSDATNYSFSVAAMDNKGNVSTESKTVTFKTLVVFKPSEAAPTPTIAATDVISVFGEHYTCVTPSANFDTWYSGGESLGTYQVAEGDQTEKVTNFGYLGFDFGGGTTVVDMSAMQYLHFDVYPEQDFSIGVTPIVKTASGSTENGKTYEIKASQWNSLNIPLTDFTADKTDMNLAKVFQIKWYGGDNKSIIYLDNIYFSKVATGVENISADNASSSANVYSVDGRMVKGNATSLEGLQHGVYIMNGKKIVVK